MKDLTRNGIESEIGARIRDRRNLGLCRLQSCSNSVGYTRLETPFAFRVINCNASLEGLTASLKCSNKCDSPPPLPRNPFPLSSVNKFECFGPKVKWELNAQHKLQIINCRRCRQCHHRVPQSGTAVTRCSMKGYSDVDNTWLLSLPPRLPFLPRSIGLFVMRPSYLLDELWCCLPCDEGQEVKQNGGSRARERRGL